MFLWTISNFYCFDTVWHLEHYKEYRTPRKQLIPQDYPQFKYKFKTRNSLYINLQNTILSWEFVHGNLSISNYLFSWVACFSWLPHHFAVSVITFLPCIKPSLVSLLRSWTTLILRMVDQVCISKPSMAITSLMHVLHIWIFLKQPMIWSHHQVHHDT